ncbi:hypothetical protein G8759_12765 [Spirosoma aureum]|uniref:Uncharacterized protein n=2 Tax=Spirosoma aureum TaxID=2692134 RepID=A0A6G9ALW3_9BACT|nr:hypothetical protein G8759_12765 [Spirosoma aureum]
MTLELYLVSSSDSPAEVTSPISNTMGELPDQEPTLDLGDLLGSFDSKEEVLTFVQTQLSIQNQQVIDSHISPFNAYTHVEWLTVTIQNEDQSTFHKNYYLVSDEGY